MNYLIGYTVTDARTGAVLNEGKMRVKNANSEFVAKAKFATYIEKQYPARGQLVIHSISKDNPMLRMFDDIFKKNNPFDKFAK